MAEVNTALAALLREAGMSLAGLARRVNDLGVTRGLHLRYDYTAVYRWIKKGERPRRNVPELIALALSERLGRSVSVAQIGMRNAGADTADAASPYDDGLDTWLSRVHSFLATDLADLSSTCALPVDTAAWNDATLSWLVRGEVRLPSDRAASPRVGASDVLGIRAVVSAFAHIDNTLGGDHARRALIQYLRSDVASLLCGQFTEPVGRDLFASAAEATLLAAWMTYDAGLHGAAQRYFLHGLRLAQTADNTLLAASIIDAMSHQATFLGHHHEAANLARAARNGTRSQQSAGLTAHFHAMEARALSVVGDATGVHRALADAVAMFERRQPGTDPDWFTYFDEAELSAEFAHCLRDLGQSVDALVHAERALERGSGSPRSDFFVTMVVAEAQLGCGDLEQACQIVTEALKLGERLKSARCVEYLRRFRRQLSAHERHTSVRTLHDVASDHPLWIAAV